MSCRGVTIRGKGCSEAVGTFGCAPGLSGASEVGYWWGFSSFYTSGSHCGGARETGTMGAGVHSTQRLGVRR